MREVTTLLYGPIVDAADRQRTMVLSDDITNYDLLRVYCGFLNDGYQVIEWDLRNRDYTSVVNFWSFYLGSTSKTNPGSLRWNDFRLNNSKKNLPIYRTSLCYLNAGTDAYTMNTNNDWGPVPVYKIVGVKFV